jgi:hypothetical protein
MEDRIKALEEAVDKLKKKPKDGWDKTQVLLAALIPIVVAFLGWTVSEAARKSQDEFTRERFKFEQSKAEIDDQYRRSQDLREATFQEKKEARESEVAHVAMIQKLAEDLGSSNKATSAAARLRLYKVEPETFAVVDAAVSQKVAVGLAPLEKSETKARQAVIADFFDDDRGKRIAAFSAIRKFYRDDTAMLAAILAEFAKHRGNPDRTYSTAAVMNWFYDRPLRENKTGLERFISDVPVNSDWAKTNEITSKIGERIRKAA